MINIPILLTMARILTVPFLVSAILGQQFAWAVSLLVFAALTDLLDGALARFLGQETALGAYLDPVADKLLVVACYGALMSIDTPYFAIPRWFIILVLVRELLILVGAAYWGLFKHALPIAPTVLGKVTTAVQLLFIGFLLLVALLQITIPLLFSLLLAGVAGCVAVSLIDYICIAYKRVG